jgi:hypothetical protein
MVNFINKHSLVPIVAQKFGLNLNIEYQNLINQNLKMDLRPAQ